MISVFLLEILFAAAFTSLWCCGVFAAFTPGYIFGSLGDWLESKLPDYITKPTFGCVICMSSVHGTFWYGVLLYDELGLWYLLPFVVVVCGLNRLLSSAL